MSKTDKMKENAGATSLAGGLTLAASSLLLPKFRKKIKKGAKQTSEFVEDKMPRVARIVDRADDPSDLKDETKQEVKDEMADQMKEKFKDSMQSKVKEASENLEQAQEENAEKVHNNADKVEKKAQNALLKFREKLSGVKEAGEDFQDKMKEKTGGSSQDKIKGVNDIKGANDIKGVNNIKSSTDIKSAKDIKHPSNTKSSS
ncbi:gas vesicle protein GvpQ [Thalassobacillus sp. B23F22_16]|uniref:gas vesicle protein GvpQ n=1 Tax=Thalassobacillus sp. B23F22_16 TaxID=3459513 RepID=UPI00373EC22F